MHLAENFLLAERNVKNPVIITHILRGACNTCSYGDLLGGSQRLARVIAEAAESGVYLTTVFLKIMRMIHLLLRQGCMSNAV
jgi:hypothetical protein